MLHNATKALVYRKLASFFLVVFSKVLHISHGILLCYFVFSLCELRAPGPSLATSCGSLFQRYHPSVLQ